MIRREGDLSRFALVLFYPNYPYTETKREIAALDGGGFPVSRLQPDFEALRAFKDDVGLESEIGFFDVRLDAEVSHNRGQDNLQLEHGVFAAHAGTRSGGERYEGVVVPIGGLLRQEVIGIENLRIRIDVWLPVHLESRHYHRSSSWNCIVSRR